MKIISYSSGWRRISFRFVSFVLFFFSGCSRRVVCFVEVLFRFFLFKQKTFVWHRWLSGERCSEITLEMIGTLSLIHLGIWTVLCESDTFIAVCKLSLILIQLLVLDFFFSIKCCIEVYYSIHTVEPHLLFFSINWRLRFDVSEISDDDIEYLKCWGESCYID